MFVLLESNNQSYSLKRCARHTHSFPVLYDGYSNVQIQLCCWRHDAFNPVKNKIGLLLATVAPSFAWHWNASGQQMVRTATSSPLRLRLRLVPAAPTALLLRLRLPSSPTAPTALLLRLRLPPTAAALPLRLRLVPAAPTALTLRLRLPRCLCRQRRGQIRQRRVLRRGLHRDINRCTRRSLGCGFGRQGWCLIPLLLRLRLPPAAAALLLRLRLPPTTA